MTFDPFGDFEQAGYLRNVQGLKDPTEVKRQEHFTFELSIDEALAFLARKRPLDYSALLEVHRILFESFYPWAGQDRAELVPHLAVFKGPQGDPHRTVFADPREIERSVAYALQLASKEERFKASPGLVLGQLCFAHPFLDGNGRSILLFFMELTFRAGFSINWGQTRKDLYLQALNEEIAHPGQGHLDAYLRNYIDPTHDRNLWPELIGQINGLDGLDSEDINYENVDDPEVQRIYAAYRAEHPIPNELDDAGPEGQPV